MQQFVRVQKCNDDHTVLVTPVQMELCPGECQSCTGCKNQKNQFQKVKNSMDASCGQVVVLTTNRVLKLFIRVCYLLPMLLMFIGFVCWQSPGGILGFTLGLVFSIWMTTKEIHAYTITGLSERPKEKGDNDLD